MLRIREVTLPLGYTDADMRRAAARILKISEKRLETVRIFRRSVDARPPGQGLVFPGAGCIHPGG